MYGTGSRRCGIRSLAGRSSRLLLLGRPRRRRVAARGLRAVSSVRLRRSPCECSAFHLVNEGRRPLPRRALGRRRTVVNCFLCTTPPPLVVKTASLHAQRDRRRTADIQYSFLAVHVLSQAAHPAGRSTAHMMSNSRQNASRRRDAAETKGREVPTVRNLSWGIGDRVADSHGHQHEHRRGSPGAANWKTSSNDQPEDQHDPVLPQRHCERIWIARCRHRKAAVRRRRGWGRRSPAASRGRISACQLWLKNPPSAMRPCRLGPSHRPFAGEGNKTLLVRPAPCCRGRAE